MYAPEKVLFVGHLVSQCGSLGSTPTEHSLRLLPRKSLLEKDPTQRLGVLAGKERDILKYEWFAELELDLLRNKLVEAPWKPPIDKNE
eukprot:scaffold11882_cov123-Cylindrotheca_fusiformis.AAC.1